MSHNSVCLFHEANIIETVVNEWIYQLACLDIHDYECILVDDGSRDNTPIILKSLAQKYSHIKIHTLPQNMGYGAAFQAGIKLARGKNLLTIDSDGQFCIEDYVLLKSSLSNSHTLANGRRSRKKDSILKVMADRVYSLLVHAILGIKAKDPNCALKLIPHSIYSRLNLRANGFSLPTEILWQAQRMRYSIVEVEIKHQPRLDSNSKLNFLSATFAMFQSILSMRLHGHRSIKENG